jgi:hypothetical protein
MTKTLIAFPRPVRTRLDCKWIETGNPRQPLACVWTDRVTGKVTALPEAEVAQATDAGGPFLINRHLCA